MTKGRIFILALAVAVSACKRGTSVQEFNGPIEQRVKFIADGVNQIAPRKLDKDVRLLGAHSDGRVLVLHIDTTLKGSVDTSDLALTKLFRPQVCENKGYRSVIDNGGIVRFQITRSSTGEALPTFSIATCG